VLVWEWGRGGAGVHIKQSLPLEKQAYTTEWCNSSVQVGKNEHRKERRLIIRGRCSYEIVSCNVICRQIQ
jgi:hypothetical protein